MPVVICQCRINNPFHMFRAVIVSMFDSRDICPAVFAQPASLSLRFASAFRCSLSLWISRVHFILLRIYHKGTSDDKFHMTTTRLLWTRLENLSPNSQYVVYVVAIAPRGASLPSETLVAWTEPALSAFVDVSSVWCARLVTCHDNLRRRRAASVKLVFT